ncbi:MAG: DUF6790 family protein [Actinomycetota bacterium]
MVFFIVQWIVLVIGVAINVMVDRHADRRTAARFVEIALLWLMVWMSAWGLVGVFAHIGPMSAQTAEQIGYAPSMFQWEVGFGDLTLSVLGIACFWFRDRWLTAAVVALAISYGGDAIGHVMQYFGDGNDAPANTWAIPSDILQPLLAIVLLVLYRRGLGRLPQMPKHGVLGTAS